MNSISIGKNDLRNTISLSEMGSAHAQFEMKQYFSCRNGKLLCYFCFYYPSFILHPWLSLAQDVI